MRFHFVNVKKLVIIGVSVISILGACIPLGIKMLQSPEVPDEEYVENETQCMPKPTDGTTPKDHSILENLQIAAGVIKDNPHFKAITEGHAITNMVIQNDQQVYTERRVDGDYALVNTVSASSFKNIASQKFFPKGDKYFIKDGKINSSDITKPIFDEAKDPVAYTRSDYLNSYGWLPTQLCSYIFAENSIIVEESKVLPSSEFAYEALVTLDLVNSIAQTKREVKTNGGAMSYPEYSSISMVVSLDDEWRVHRISYHDVYEITVKMGVALTAPVDSNLVENFYYEDYEIDQSLIDYYSRFASLETGGNDTPTKKNAMDYISESMLGMALAGSTLDTKVQVDDYTLAGKIYCKFDIKTTNLKFLALFNNFYLKYDKDFYLSYRKYNYKLNEDYFKHLLEVINIDIDSLISSFSCENEKVDDSSSNGLMDQLSNLLLENNDGKVVVRGSLNMDGVSLSFALNMSEDENGAILDSIVLDGVVDNKVIKGTILVTGEKIIFEDVDYVDLSSSSWVIDSIYNIVSYEGYQNDISYSYKDYDVNINSYLDKNKNAKVLTTLHKKDKEDINLEFTYFDSKIYFTMGNLALEVEKEEAESLINLIANYLISNSKEEEQIDISVEDIMRILDVSYEVFEGISIGNNDEINISLALSKIIDGGSDTVLEMYQKEDILCFESKEYSLVMNLKEYKDTLNKEDRNYLNSEDAKICIDFYKDIFDIVTSEEYSFEFKDLSLKQNDLIVKVDGFISRNAHSIYSKLTLKYDSTYYIEFLFEEGEGYYLGLEGYNTSIHLFLDEKEMLKLIDDLINQYYEISEDYDLNNIINDFVTSEKEKLIDMIKNNPLSVDETLSLVYDILTFVQNANLEVVDERIIATAPNKESKLELLRENSNISLIASNISYEDYIGNGKISLSKETKEITIRKPDYVDISMVVNALDNITYELNENNITFADILLKAKDIASHNGYNFSLSTSYIDYSLDIEVFIDSNKNILGRAYARDKDNNQIRLDVAYDKDKLYIIYGNIAFEATNDNLCDIAYLIKQMININKKEDVDILSDTLILGTSLNLSDILNKVFSIYKGIDILPNGDVNISLMLSSLDKGIDDITLKLYEVNNVIYMSSSSYNIMMSLKEFDGEVEFSDTLSYLSTKDINDTYDLILSIGECLVSSNLCISIDGSISLNKLNLSYVLSYKKNHDDYSINLALSGDLDTTLDLRYIDGKYYLVIYYDEHEVALSGDASIVKRIINDVYNNRYDLVKEETINELYVRYLKDAIEGDKKEPTLESIIPYVFDVFYRLQDAKLTHKENELSFDFENNSIDVSKIENEYSINGNVEFDNKRIVFSSMISNKNESIDIEDKDYFSLDTILEKVDSSLIAFIESDYTIEDLVALVCELKSYDNYHIETIYKYGKFDISLDVEVSKSLKNVYMSIDITRNEEHLKLVMIYENDKVYITFGSINIILDNNDLSDICSLIHKYLSSNGFDENRLDVSEYELRSIITKAFEVYDSISFDSEGNINVLLLLSSLNYRDTIITLGTNDNNELFISCEEPLINIVIHNVETITASDKSKTYLTRVEFDEFIKSLEDANNIINNYEMIEIELNNIKFIKDDLNALINGYIVSNEGRYQIYLDINGTYVGDIKLSYLDKKYYLDLLYEEYSLKVSLSENELMTLVDTLITNKDKFFGNIDVEGYLNSYLRPIVDSILDNSSLDNSLDLAFDVLNEIQNNGNLVYEDGVFKVIYKGNQIIYKNDEYIGLELIGSDFDELSISGSIKISNEVDDVLIEGEYYSLNLLVNKLTMILDSFAASSLSVSDLYNDVNHISSYIGYNVLCSYSYEGYNVTLDAIITRNLRIEANLLIQKEGREDLLFNIKYINNRVYVEYNNINIVVNSKDVDDIFTLLNKYTDISKDEVMEIEVSTILDNCLEALDSFVIDDDNYIIIGVALSKFVDTKDIKIDFFYDKNLDKMILVLNDYAVNVEIKETSKSVLLGDKEYLSSKELNEVIDILKEGKEIIDSNKYVIKFENIKVTLDEQDYVLNGDFRINDKKLELNLNILVDEKNYIISLRRLDNRYYLDLNAFNKEFNVVLTESEIASLFIDIYEGRSGLLNEENLNKLETKYISKFEDLYNSFKNKDYSALTGEFDLNKTLETVYDVMEYLLSSTLRFENHVLTYEDEMVKVSLKKEEGIILALNVSKNNVLCEGTLKLISEEVEIKNKNIEYVSLDRIVSKIDEIVLSLKDSSLTIEDLIDFTDEVISFKGYNVQCDFIYDDYNVSLNVFIDETNDVMGIINISKVLRDSIKIRVYYYDERVYFEYENIEFVFNKQEINSGIRILSEYISLTDEEISNEKIQELLDKSLDVLSDLRFDSEGKLIISLALSSIVDVDDIIINVTLDRINNRILLDGNSYSLNMVVKEYLGDILSPNGHFISLNDAKEVIDILKEGKEIVDSNKYVIKFESVKVTLDEQDYVLNGDFRINDKKLELNLNILVDEKNYIISLRRLDNRYYLDLNAFNKEFNVVLTESEIASLFIDIYEGRSGLLNEENLNKLETKYISKFEDLYNSFKNKDYSALTGEFDLNKTLETVYDVMEYLLSSTLRFENHVLTYEDEMVKVSLKKEEGIILALNVNKNNVLCEGTLKLISEEVEIKNENIEYVSLDRIISKIDELVLSLKDSSLTIEDLIDFTDEVISFKGYNVQCDFIYDDYNVSLNVFIDETNDVMGIINISKALRDPIKIRVYYYDERVYFEYENIEFVFNKQEINSGIRILSEYISLTDEEINNEKIQELLDKSLDVLSDLRFDSEGKLIISLALSSIVDVDDIIINVTLDRINNRILLDGNSYSLNMVVKEYLGDILSPDGHFISLSDANEVIDILKEGKEIVDSNKYVIKFESVKLTLDEQDYVLNGDFRVNDKKLELNLNILVNEKNYIISLRRLDNRYYLDLNAFNKEFNVVLSEEEIASLFIDIYEGRSGLLNEENLNKLETKYISKFENLYNSFKNKDYSALTGEFDLNKTLETVYDVMEYLLSSTLRFENHVLTYEDEMVKVSLKKEEGIILALNVNKNNVLCDGTLKLISEEVEIKNENIEYVSLDRIISKIDEIVLSLKDSSLTIEDLIDEGKILIDYKGYSFDLSYIYNDEYKVDVYLDITKNLEIKGIIELSHLEDKISLEIYYVDDVLYVIYGNINLRLEKEDIKDTIRLILKATSKKDIDISNPETSEEYQKILDTIVDVIESFEIDDNNHLIISLALQKAFVGLDKVVIDASWNAISGSINVEIPKYHGSALIHEFDGEISIPQKEYLGRSDLDTLLSLIDETLSILVDKKKYSLTINPSLIRIKDNEIGLVGSFIQNEDRMSLNLSLSTSTKDYAVACYRVEGIYYLELVIGDNEPVLLKGEEEYILKLINNIMDNKDSLLGEMSIEDYFNKYLGADLGKTSDYTFDEILKLGFEALLALNDASLDVNERRIDLTHEKLQVSLSNVSSHYDLRLLVNDLENVSMNINLSLVESNSEIIAPNKEYFNLNNTLVNLNDVALTLIESGWSLDEVITFTKDIASFEGYKVVIDDLNLCGFEIHGEVIVDNNFDISLSLNVKYGEDEVSFNIFFVDDYFYLEWENYRLFLNAEDVVAVGEMIMDFMGMQKMSLSELYEMIDRINEIYVKTTSVKGENVTLSLALSTLFNELEDVDVVFTYDGTLHINSIQNNINIDVINYSGESNKPTFTKDDAYLKEDFEVLLDYAKGFKEYLYEGQLSLTFDDTNNPLIIQFNENDQLMLHGSINLRMVKVEDGPDKVTFSMKVYMTGMMHYYVALEYNEDEELYITFSTNWNDDYGDLISKTSFMITRDQIKSLFKEILMGIDENSEIGKLLSPNDINNINMVKDILVKTGVLDKNEIEIGKVEMSLKGIVPIVYKVLDFLKDATISPNREDRSILLKKDIDVTVDGETVSTSTTIRLFEEKVNNGINKDISTNYHIQIDNLEANSIKIHGRVTIKRYDDIIYVDKSNVMVLTKIEDLSLALFNSIEKMQFNISGIIKAKLLGIYNIDVDVQARVSYVGDEIEGYIYLDVPCVGIVTVPTGTLTAKYIHTEIFIQDGVIYMYKDYSYTEWFKTKHQYSYRKNTYSGFMNNIMDNVIFIFNLQKTIVDAMTNSTNDFVLVPDKLLKSYSYVNDSFNMVIDLPNGLSTSMFKELTLSTKIAEYEGEKYLSSFSGETTMFSVINAKFEFNEIGCFGNPPDMTIIPRNMKSNENYQFYNE